VIKPVTRRFMVERVTRIELALSAWEADVLPLNYTRTRRPAAQTAGRSLAPTSYPSPEAARFDSVRLDRLARERGGAPHSTCLSIRNGSAAAQPIWLPQNAARSLSARAERGCG
jgi:hypothetical protein